MNPNALRSRSAATVPAARKPWLAPRVDDLPRLTELTLQTGGAIPGSCEIGGGGSTCF